MASEEVAQLLADALRGLVRFVDERTEDATADDDVRALEDVAYVLSQVADEDRSRLLAYLGAETAQELGLT